MFNPNKNLTQGEKKKLRVGDELTEIAEAEGLKAIIELLEDSLERTEWHKVGLRLSNDYQKIEKIEDIEAKYDRQYPTDKDL